MSPRPSIHTDAYEDDVRRDVPLVFLAGPIKYWWSRWNSSEHKAYLKHRLEVREALIEAGYLTYAPWDALKGTWTERAQVINDIAISAAGVMVVLTPLGVLADGTAAETDKASRVGTPVIRIPPGTHRVDLLEWVAARAGPGHPY